MRPWNGRSARRAQRFRRRRPPGRYSGGFLVPRTMARGEAPASCGHYRSSSSRPSQSGREGNVASSRSVRAPVLRFAFLMCVRTVASETPRSYASCLAATPVASPSTTLRSVRVRTPGGPGGRASGAPCVAPPQARVKPYEPARIAAELPLRVGRRTPLWELASQRVVSARPRAGARHDCAKYPFIVQRGPRRDYLGGDLVVAESVDHRLDHLLLPRAQRARPNKAR